MRRYHAWGLRTITGQAPAKILLVGTAAFLLFASSASADLISRFDAGAEGWRMVLGEPAVYRASGGNPGGHLEFTAHRDGSTTFVSPSVWHGDQRAAIGRDLRFDLRVPAVDGPDRPIPLVMLQSSSAASGGSSTLVWSAGVVPSTSWQHFDVPVGPGPGWTRASDGGAATADDFDRVLRDFGYGGLQIAAALTLGSGSTIALDNVVFEGANPPPAQNTDLSIGINFPGQSKTTGFATVTVKNRGPRTASKVVVHVRLPSKARRIRVPRGFGCKSTGAASFVCRTSDEMPTPNDDDLSFTWKPSRAGTQTMRATVSHAGVDPHPGNNTATHKFKRPR